MLVVGCLGHYLLDLNVYRLGGLAVLHGTRLYDAREVSAGLRFTYTPFAAVLFAAPSALPLTVLRLMWTASSLLALYVLICVLQRAAQSRRDAALVFTGALMLEPVRETLAFGQVNLLLMVIVVVDLVDFVPVRYRGLLTGVAAAVKLTPLVFLPFLLLTNQRAAARRLVLAFTSCSALAFAVLPRDSLAYWTRYVHDTSRIGDSSFATNQSLAGMLARFHHAGEPQTGAYLAATCVAVVVGYSVAVRANAHSKALGVVVTGLVGLLLSPISWSHHWVWFCALPVVGARVLSVAQRVGLTLVTFLSPFAYLPHRRGRESRWGWWEMLLGNAYTITALVTLVLLAWALRRQRGGRPPLEPPQIAARPCWSAPMPEHHKVADCSTAGGASKRLTD